MKIRIEWYINYYKKKNIVQWDNIVFGEKITVGKPVERPAITR